MKHNLESRVISLTSSLQAINKLPFGRTNPSRAPGRPALKEFLSVFVDDPGKVWSGNEQGMTDGFTWRLKEADQEEQQPAVHGDLVVFEEEGKWEIGKVSAWSIQFTTGSLASFVRSLELSRTAIHGRVTAKFPSAVLILTEMSHFQSGAGKFVAVSDRDICSPW